MAAVARTKAAQNAIERARNIVCQNDLMVERIYENFGLSLNEEIQLETEEERVQKAAGDYYLSAPIEEDFKINTSSKIKNYFGEIINSIH